MSNPPGPKEKTVTAAAKLLRRQGYHGTALNDILDAAGSPRGSLYFHFPKGKEEIGEAALAFAGEAVRQAIAGAAASSESAAVFLSRIARGMAADLEKSGFTEGCPIATTSLEVAGQSEVLTTAARVAFQSWETEIKLGLERFGIPTAISGETATAVLSQLEGALLLARTYRSLEPMHRAESAIAILLRAAAGS